MGWAGAGVGICKVHVVCGGSWVSGVDALHSSRLNCDMLFVCFLE